MKPATLLLVYTILSGYSFAQDLQLINYHSNCSKLDINQLYINRRGTEIKTLNDLFWEDGVIIRKGDTIQCKLYLPKHKINSDNYVYTIARCADGKYYLFTPKDIDGYITGSICMKTHRSVTGVDTSYFFIKEVEKGAVTLYEREAIPSDKEFKYYFKKSGEKDLLFIAPDKKSDIYVQEHYSNGDMLSKYNGPDEDQFRKVLAEYLKDCESVHNKISSKFYSANDLDVIIKEYNHCVIR